MIAQPGQHINVSSLLSVTAGNNPPYLVVSLLDRNEYTAASNGNTGTLSGNGLTADFASIGGDGDSIGIVFTWNAATGQYTNSTYGNLANLTYTASTNSNDNTSLSIFGTSSLAYANAYAADPYVLSANPGVFAYDGSVSIVTEPHFAGPAPAQATPDSICSAALSFVGDAWNMDGCWVLASDIAAEAGASLPLTSTSLFVPGQANGEWIVAYDGPAGQTGNWQSMVHAGEVVVLATSSNSGHITTVVSGSGSTAELVDNITYVYANGTIANPANDGSANDITIAAPHLASQEWAQAVSGSVVIYELDTPIVADDKPIVTLGADAADPLSSMFATTDPGGRAITEYQFYDTSSLGSAVANSFSVGGEIETASSAGQAITVNAAGLSGADFLSGSTTIDDTLDIRAFNGLYWGDWQTMAIDVTAPSAPVVTALTANQTWTDGQGISFALASHSFTDPQQESLTYSARQVDGVALPSWLSFNGATDSFSGTMPVDAIGTMRLDVTARDSSGLAATETFTVAFAPADASPSTSPTYSFALGTGAEQITPAPGVHGELDFGAGIATDQLWLARSGNNLQIDVMGTHDQATIAGWYANTPSQLQGLETVNGSMLDTQLQSLVTAMATYSTAHPGFDPTVATQAPSDPTLQATLAAAWHHCASCSSSQQHDMHKLVRPGATPPPVEIASAALAMTAEFGGTANSILWRLQNQHGSSCHPLSRPSFSGPHAPGLGLEPQRSRCPACRGLHSPGWLRARREPIAGAYRATSAAGLPATAAYD